MLNWHFCWQDARLTEHPADLAFLLAKCQADSAPCWPGIFWQDARLIQRPADMAFLLARFQADSAPCWHGIFAGKMPGWSIILRTWFLQLTGWLNTLLTWYCQLPGWPYHP
jgi:hypothetical protein